jgi:CRP/FNR family transcriptional regulator, cyclic AMP receptor protein
MKAGPTVAADTERRAEILGRVSLFGGLGRRQLRRLAEHTTTRSYAAGDVILREGDTSMSFYVILSGSVRVVRDAGEESPLIIGRMGELSFFGEMGLIDDMPRVTTIVAAEPTECAMLAKWDFESQLRNQPDIALALIPVLNTRIRELQARLAGNPPPGDSELEQRKSKV